MIRKRYNQIPHQTDIEIKDGVMYLTACIKQHKERAKKNSLFTLDCHQIILNKANKSLKTVRKKNTQLIPCLGTISNKSMGGAGLKQVSLVRKCKSDLRTGNILT